MKRGMQVPPDMFALRGTVEDFAAAQRELGPLPFRGRPLRLANDIVRFYRVPARGDNSWPTTGDFLRFHIQVIASGVAIATEDEPNQG